MKTTFMFDRNLIVDTKVVILSFRQDLRSSGMGLRGVRRSVYLTWLVAHGLRLYPALAGDVELKAFLSCPEAKFKQGLSPLQTIIYQARPDVQAAYPLKTELSQYLWWFYTFGLDEHHYWSFLTEAEKDFVRALPEPWVSRLTKLSDAKSCSKPSPVAFQQQTFGVNVIGYAYGQLGIGEDARMAARACLAAQVPFNMVSFAPGANIGQNDRSMHQYVVERGEFVINLFCLTAEETGRYYAEQGASQFINRYNIGYWPWELGAWPDAWQMLFDLVDEVWVSSQHIFDALVPVCNKPVYLMPMAVDLGPVKQFKSQRQARAHFGLPAQAKLFCFSFDLNSYIERKNPQACVEAFLRAFAQDEYSDASVGLVIKVHAPKQPNKDWDKLKALAACDSRVHIIEQTLDRPDLLALYQTCDCFVSLHRAEGFGRGLAEALQLGLRVICTGYSGNLDFCHAPMAELVDYRLVKVGQTEYPHAKGQYWAEPRIQHAAELMQKVFALTEAMPKSRQKPTQKQTQPSKGFAEFSPLVVGKLYKQRLKEIYAKRNEVKLTFYSDF